MDIKLASEKYESYIVEQRRWFHAHPELSFQEIMTTQHIMNELEAMGLKPEKFDGLEGCYAYIHGKKADENSKTVILRADIDALPVVEKTGLPFTSQNPGIMHACGHDCHAAMLLGAAKILLDMQEELQGSVKLFFQGAEESCNAAVKYIEKGVLEGADAIYGQHIWGELDAPYLNTECGARMAAGDSFKITVHGKSCHGSAPNNGVDAIAAAAAIVNALHTVISRNSDPREAASLTIGTIHGGTRFNIIADKVVLEGTARTHSKEMHTKLPMLMKRIVEYTAASLGAQAVVEYERLCPALINEDETCAKIAQGAAKKLVGTDAICPMKGLMSSEDFAYYLEKLPGHYAYIGSRDARHPYANHNDKYDVDESQLIRGAAMYAQFAADYLYLSNTNTL